MPFRRHFSPIFLSFSPLLFSHWFWLILSAIFAIDIDRHIIAIIFHFRHWYAITLAAIAAWFSLITPFRFHFIDCRTLFSLLFITPCLMIAFFRH
jgi:hypothetical protein